MSLLVATPMYGGQCTAAYFNSCLRLQEAFLRGGMAYEWLTTTNESLIPRARNTSAATFLKTDLERLIFIDADIEFRPEDVAKLWNLDADVAVGLYPMKRLDCPLGAWRGGRLVDLSDCPKEPFPVDYAGTGFFMVHRRAFEKMIEAYPEIRHEEGHIGECWAFFDTAVEDGIFWSEDYLFCKRWRATGGKIIADPSIELVHHGAYAYGA